MKSQIQFRFLINPRFEIQIQTGHQYNHKESPLLQI